MMDYEPTADDEALEITASRDQHAVAIDYDDKDRADELGASHVRLTVGDMIDKRCVSDGQHVATVIVDQHGALQRFEIDEDLAKDVDDTDVACLMTGEQVGDLDFPFRAAADRTEHVDADELTTSDETDEDDEIAALRSAGEALAEDLAELDATDADTIAVDAREELVKMCEVRVSTRERDEYAENLKTGEIYETGRDHGVEIEYWGGPGYYSVRITLDDIEADGTETDGGRVMADGGRKPPQERKTPRSFDADGVLPNLRAKCADGEIRYESRHAYENQYTHAFTLSDRDAVAEIRDFLDAWLQHDADQGTDDDEDPEIMTDGGRVEHDNSVDAEAHDPVTVHFRDGREFDAELSCSNDLANDAGAGTWVRPTGDDVRGYEWRIRPSGRVEVRDKSDRLIDDMEFVEFVTSPETAADDESGETADRSPWCTAPDKCPGYDGDGGLACFSCFCEVETETEAEMHGLDATDRIDADADADRELVTDGGQPRRMIKGRPAVFEIAGDGDIVGRHRFSGTIDEIHTDGRVTIRNDRGSTVTCPLRHVTVQHDA